MATIYNLKLFEKGHWTGLGEKICTPLEYFDFGPSPVELIDIAGGCFIKMDKITAEDTILVGGGGLLYNHQRWDRYLTVALESPAKVIGWGLGVNNRNEADTRRARYRPEHLIVPPPRKPYWRTRDFDYPGTGKYDWVPCPTCMHPAFDAAIATRPSHPAVIYSRHTTPVPYGMLTVETPRLEDDTHDMMKTLKFIASGRYVVTNSYHGAYWAWLLQRVPIIYRPWSTCFAYYPFAAYCPIIWGVPSLNTLNDAFHDFPIQTDALPWARSRNMDYYAFLVDRGMITPTPRAD